MQKILNIEKIIFKVAQIKLITMHINNQKIFYYMNCTKYLVVQNDFCRKIKMYNFDPYNVLLHIATNIPVLLMTAFVTIVVHGICLYNKYYN